MRHHLKTLATAGAVARIGAAFVAEQARRAVHSAGRFHFAVSGRHTPWAMFAELAAETVPWEAVVAYQVDERVAAPEDPDRNLRHLEQALGAAPARVQAMPSTACSHPRWCRQSWWAEATPSVRPTSYREHRCISSPPILRGFRP